MIQMNLAMRELFARAGAAGVPDCDDSSPLQFTERDGCVFLSEALTRSAETLADFADRTACEAVLNQAHLPYDGGDPSLVRALAYVDRLCYGLLSVAKGRRFQVIAAFSDAECDVSFHQLRPGETWLDDDLESYRDEAVLVLSVGRLPEA
jgi:hypothetical protein